MEEDFLEFASGFETEEETSMPETVVIEAPPVTVIEETGKRKQKRDRSAWKHVQARFTPEEYKRFNNYMERLGVDNRADHIRALIMKEVDRVGIELVESDE